MTPHTSTTARTTRSTAALAGLALVVTGCGAGMGGGTGGEEAQETSGEFDWKRFEGESISVMLNEHPWTDGVKEHLGEFEELTGIDVELNTYSEDLYTAKVEQAVRSGEAPGVYMLQMDDFAATQYDAGLVEPLTPYLDNPSLTSDEYDFDDFPSGLVDPVRFPAGDSDAQVYSVPIATESYILFYNEKLVDEYLGGEVPKTMDGLIAAAQQITTKGGGDVFGSVVRGVRSDGLRDTITAMVLNQWALDREIEAPYNVWFDGSWDEPRLTDPSIVNGLSDYAALVAAGPSNRFNLDWPDATSLFAQGKAAFFIDASVFGPGFEDPESSAIAGDVGYAPLPTGDVEGSTGVWSWGLSIAKNAGNKGASWLFLQWATTKELTGTLGIQTGGAPRQSSSESEEYLAALNPEFVRVTAEVASTARTTAVLRTGWKPGVFVIVDAVLAIAQGEDPETVLTEANDLMRATLQ
ncbi:extracellular solute-binding protein [Phytoactinopolyspora endophytica]|uniref:extracellular solute-binding protein n=1 Tax=Phytoactinopolyspora endophytica TaxID=1642495 RepID=UPI00101D7487|nr:extracellular solute-binding protein [Phytoactinopolyspora endophytica]